MGREDGGNAADKARELDRIGRQAQAEGRTEGGLTDADLNRIEQSQRREDLERLDREALARDREEMLRQREEEAQPRPAESILDQVAPHGTAGMGVMGLTPDPAPQLTGGMLDALKKPANMLRLAAVGLGMVGLLLLFWGLRVEAQQTGAVPTFTPPPAPPTLAQTAAPSQRVTTPISAGPVIATQTETTTSYVVGDVQGDGLRYEWRHSATCGTHSGEATAEYSWDHPHPPCPSEPFHGSFISVQITDASGQAVVRQYTAGSRPGQGTVPSGGGAFTAQTTPGPAGTATPTGAASAAPTVAPTATAGGVNFPLSGLGIIFLVGALGLFFGGPRLAGGPVVADPRDAEDPCAKEKARLAAAEAACAAADERLRRIDALHQTAQDAQADAAAKERAANDAATAPGVSSYVNSAGQTVYTNAQQRAAIESARAAATSARAAADAAQRAYDAAGGSGERQAAADESFRTHREQRDAKAALDACLHIVSLATPTPAPQPATGGGTTTTGGTGVGIGTGTGTGNGTRTRRRGCTEGEKRNETTTEHRFSMHDVGNAEIVTESTRQSDDDSHARRFLDHLERVNDAFGKGKIGAGLAQGEVVGPILDSVEFPDFLTYFGEIRESLDSTMERLLEQLRQHRRQGTYTIRYTTHHFLLTCRKWEECDGEQFVARSDTSLSLVRSAAGSLGPEVLTDEESRRRWLDGWLGRLRSQNENAQRRADEFRQECGP